jgi:hypothetical protein
MVRIQQWQSERARLNTAKINRDESESGATYRGKHLRPNRISYRSQEILGRQFHPRYVVVVAHPELREAQLPQRGLGAVDLVELCGRDGMVMGNPRRQAGRSRFVGHFQVQGPCNGTHVTLRQSRRCEGPEHSVIGGGAGTCPVRPSGIVGVFPVCDGVELEALGDVIFDPAEKLVLAIETAIGPVRLILRAITLVGFDLDNPYADVARDLVR